MSNSPAEPPLRTAAALHYDRRTAAPVVTAKGHGAIAEEIIKRAREASVPVHESRELAALLMNVELDHAIPPQLYRVIAELLAWVYSIERARSPHADPPHA